MNYRFLITMLLFTSALFSQEKTLDCSVNFRKNRSGLSKSELKKLDAVINELKQQPALPYFIYIKGFTDSDADSLYNYKLSAERCKSVNDYIVQHGISDSLIRLFPMGEELSPEEYDEKIKLKNRRVDLIVAFKEKDDPVLADPDQPKSKCNRDTTIQLSNGVLAVFNACDYQKQKDCIVLKTQKRIQYDIKYSRLRRKLGFKNPYKVRRKYTTYDINYSCKNSGCGKINVSMLIPFFEVKEKEYSVKRFDFKSMSFKDHKTAKIKSVNKKRYIAIRNMDCNYGEKGGGCYSINCGASHKICSCSKSKMKFRNGIKILKVNDIERIEDYTTINISKNKKKLYFYPGGGIFDSLTVLNGKDTITIKNVQISALRHGILRSKSCSIRWFLFMKFHSRCNTYRKYKFRKDDIEIQTTQPWASEEE